VNITRENILEDTIKFFQKTSINLKMPLRVINYHFKFPESVGFNRFWIVLSLSKFFFLRLLNCFVGAL